MKAKAEYIKTQLSNVYYPQISYDTFCVNLRNGRFNRLCYEVYKAGVMVNNDSSPLMRFAANVYASYEIAWYLLVEGHFYKDWGLECIGSEICLVSPSYSKEGEKSCLFMENDSLGTMLSMLWLILMRVDLNDENITFCKNARDLRIAVCYQIRKFLIANIRDLSFLENLCKAFDIHMRPQCMLPIEERVGLLSLDAVVNGNVRYSLSRIRKYTDATYEEIGQAIIRISSDIKSECHWNAITIVLMNIDTFRRFIDEKYPHKEGKSKDKVKKFIVYEIAELINTDREKLYENVRHAAGTYSHVQQKFRSILEEILTT